VKILERGGAAAALMIERLREARRWIEPLEVSPDSLWVCREFDLLAPLLEWSGPDEALRPFVEAPQAAAAPPARLPDAGMSSQRRRSLPEGPAARPVTDAVGMGARLETNQRVARILAEAGAEPDAVRGHPESGSRAAARTLTKAITERAHRRDDHRDDQGSGSETTAASSLQEAQPAPESPRRKWLGTVPSSERFAAQSPLDREEAARRLQSLFAGDERLLRAWDQVMTETPPSPEVSAILAEPDSRRMIRMDAPADPIGALLEAVVDRAGQRPSTKTRIEPPGSRLLSPDSTSGEARRPRWDAPTNREETSRPFAEPPRTSALRRLASYGETIEPERVLSMPSPSPAAPKEAPQQQRRVAFERADLAEEVSEIFRREALRHGIVSEEETL